MQDHRIVERHKSCWAIGRWVEVGPELVQGKTCGHASGCGGRVALPPLTAKGRKKKDIKKSVVGTVGELGGDGVLSICGGVLGQCAVTDDEVGGNNIVRLILVDHVEISDRWTLTASAVARGRYSDSASIYSSLGLLHKLVATAVSILAKEHTVQSIDTPSSSGSSKRQAGAVCTIPTSDGRVGGKRDLEGSDEVLSNNISLLDNKRVVYGNISSAVIDGALDE